MDRLQTDNGSLLILCTDASGKNSSAGRILEVTKGKDYGELFCFSLSFFQKCWWPFWILAQLFCAVNIAHDINNWVHPLLEIFYGITSQERNEITLTSWLTFHIYSAENNICCYECLSFCKNMVFWQQVQKHTGLSAETVKVKCKNYVI